MDGRDIYTGFHHDLVIFFSLFWASCIREIGVLGLVFGITIIHAIYNNHHCLRARYQSVILPCPSTRLSPPSLSTKQFSPINHRTRIPTPTRHFTRPLIHSLAVNYANRPLPVDATWAILYAFSWPPLPEEARAISICRLGQCCCYYYRRRGTVAVFVSAVDEAGEEGGWVGECGVCCGVFRSAFFSSTSRIVFDTMVFE